MTTPEAPRAIVEARIVRADEGESIPAAGVEHLFKLTGDNTGGLLGVEEFVLPAGIVGARPHIHRAHDEYFFVLSGRLTVTTGSGDHVLEPGDLAHAPRGSIHGYRNDDASVDVRALCLYTPRGTSSTSGTSTTRWRPGRSSRSTCSVTSGRATKPKACSPRSVQPCPR